jgi:hypothetical protein
VAEKKRARKTTRRIFTCEMTDAAGVDAVAAVACLWVARHRCLRVAREEPLYRAAAVAFGSRRRRLRVIREQSLPRAAAAFGPRGRRCLRVARELQ